MHATVSATGGLGGEGGGGPSKAAPETSTTPANATGILDSHSLSHRDPQNVIQSSDRQFSSPRPSVHSYGTIPQSLTSSHMLIWAVGNDPHIHDLLQKVYEESFFEDGPDFGTPIPLPSQPSRPLRPNNNRPHTFQNWHPEGTLIAHFTEHRGPINRVVVAPDHSFFVTCSDDGTVKIWDTVRLEKNVVNRVRQTHRHEGTGVKIKSICFIDSTHCVASAGDDGSINIFKVDYSIGTLTPKYGKLKIVRKHKLDQGEYVMCMESYRQDHCLILIIATNLSRVIAFDLRTMHILFSLHNPSHHGTPTCFCIDKSNHAWLLLGTSRGILDLWDLRFLIRLKAWGLPPYRSIKRLTLHPTRGHGKWVCVAGGANHGEITVWDIDKLQCREVYRANGGQDGTRSYDAYKIDDDKPEGPLGRFAVEPDHKLDAGLTVAAEWTINSIIVGRDNVRPDGSVDLKSNGGFIVSVGADRKVRFWDLGKAEASMVVSGLDVEETKPTFSLIQSSPSLAITTERRSLTASQNQKDTGSGKKRSTGRPSRQAFISLQQEKLLKNHLDAIMDVALIESPFAMIVSVDRAGCINIFA